MTYEEFLSNTNNFKQIYLTHSVALQQPLLLCRVKELIMITPKLSTWLRGNLTVKEKSNTYRFRLFCM